MVIQLCLTRGHVTEYVVNNRYPLKAVVIVLGAFHLKVPEFLHCLLDLLLLHQAHAEVVLSLEVDLNKLLLQLSYVGGCLQLLLHLLRTLIISFLQI